MSGSSKAALLFEMVARSDQAIKRASMEKSAILGMAASIGKYIVRNPLKSLGAAMTVSDVAEGAKKGTNIANQVAASVSNAPRFVGPTY